MEVIFVASGAVIAPDPARRRQLSVDALGLPLEAAKSSEYWHSEQLAGSKSFGIWPLSEAAQACLGQPQWPVDRPAPQASIEFEVADPAAVHAAAEELEDGGFELLHGAREEPWGQTVARLLSDEHEGSPLWAFARHGLGRVAIKRAPATIFLSRRELAQGFDRYRGFGDETHTGTMRRGPWFRRSIGSCRERTRASTMCSEP